MLLDSCALCELAVMQVVATSCEPVNDISHVLGLKHIPSATLLGHWIPRPLYPFPTQNDTTKEKHT